MAKPKSKSGEMPFLDHLEELRWRIIYSLGSVLVAVGIGFWITLQFRPRRASGASRFCSYLPEHVLYFTHPSDKFSITLNTSMTVGLVLAAPIILYQLWLFLAPALHVHEKRVGIGVLFSGTILFISGAALAYFVVVPLALPWLLDFGSASMKPLITAEEYFGFLFAMVLTFGISFELPIVVLALAALNIVTPQFLSKYRRHAIVAIIVIGAFLTPGDLVWTTIALAVPLYALYELSVLGAVRHLPRKDTTSRGAGGGGAGGGPGVKAARRPMDRRGATRCRDGANIARRRSFPAGRRFVARADCSPSGAIRSRTARRSSGRRLTRSRSRCSTSADYTITRYQGDTAFFDAERKALDLLAAKKRPRDRRSRLAGRRQRQRDLLQRGDAPRHDRRPLRDETRRRPGRHHRATDAATTISPNVP